MDIPEYYSHCRDVFCPKKATQLPPHRPWDCAIDLLPGESVPKGKNYPLPLPEQKSMEEYIEEDLQQGYIHPSTFPAASSFFFVAKKDGGLWPCIDYRSLNNLEHLRGATIFTKLELRSVYNLIRIREGDEWKTAFMTLTGHYEYLVMTYGLVNAPSVFQDFMHEVLREYLQAWYTSMISPSTLGACLNIATTLRRSFNACRCSASSSKLRNAHFINHPYNSWVIILTVVAFGWTRGRWRPLRPGHNHQRTPTLPGILQLLPPLHKELQYPYQSTHELTPQQAQVSVLVHSRQGSYREVKDVFHTSSHPCSSGSRKTLHC